MGLIDTIHYYAVENVDQRTKDWPFVSSLTQVPMMLVIYLLFVFYLGPRYMKNRPAYSLKRFIQFFDIFQIISNICIVYLFIDAGWYKDIWIYCVPVSYTTEPGPMKIATALWWVMVLKLLDLIETGIYVLRKKDRQISVLHIYHHISTALFSWLSMKWIAGGMASFDPLINCSVHVIMYTYYFLASCGPDVQKVILPYKPLLTIIQMTQFVILIIHNTQGVLPSCRVPRIPGILMLLNLFINFYLFYDFYQKTYTKPKTKKK